MDKEVLAYVAGLFDGEGSITIGKSNPATYNTLRSPSHWLQVGITNTNKNLIDWLCNTFGGHISNNSHCPSRKKQRPCWAWRKNSNEAAFFLKSIFPFSKIKQEQMKLAIEFQEKRKGSKGNKGCLTQQVIQERDDYKQKISKLALGYRTI